MKISKRGLSLTEFFEGFSPVIYLCSAGVKTIGIGHALRPGEDKRWENGITYEDALLLLRKDIILTEQAVNRLITVPLNQQMFDSLVSWTFNLGSGALQRSTLRSVLNRQEYNRVPEEMRKWVYAGGIKLKGLIYRRELEAGLFGEGILNGL